MSYTISKSFSFCYGHRLLDDKGKCRHLHGHSVRATFVLKADSLDGRGMVCHFDGLKETIGAWIANTLDHTMLLSEGDPLVKVLKGADERINILPCNPTAENIARILFEKACEMGLSVVRVDVWESDTSMASYG